MDMSGYWTEFLIAHLGALHDYSADSGDISLARYVLHLS